MTGKSRPSIFDSLLRRYFVGAGVVVVAAGGVDVVVVVPNPPYR
jgi:hypothetical protein